MFREYIPQALMILAAGGLLFIFGRKVPHSMKDLEKETVLDQKDQGWSWKQFKEKVVNNLEKILRKIKVFIGKSDVKLMELIQRLRQKGEEKKEIKRQKEAEVAKEREAKKMGKEEVVKERDFFRTSDETFKAIDSGEDKRDAKLEEAMKAEVREEISLKKDETPKEKKGFSFGFSRKLGLGKKRGASESVASNFRKKEPVRPVIIPMKDINIAEAKRVMFEREEKLLIKKISMNPRNDAAYVALGKLYRDSNNLEDAKASLEQALKLNRGNIAAKRVLREIESKM